MCVGGVQLPLPPVPGTQEIRMMPADPATLIAALGVEPTYSAREAAALLGRSYSWLDRRLRAGQFTNPDGSVLQPLRTPGAVRTDRKSVV